MKVAEVVGRTLAALGVEQAFGVVGSGNFHLTNALITGGATFVAARHELGATMMADAFSRLTGQVSAVSLHQGCGFTNALTGVTEAAKSRTPLIVVTADTPPTMQTSNFWIKQADVATALGAKAERVYGAGSAVEDAARAYWLARLERRTVVLNLPLDVQELECDWDPTLVPAFVRRSAPGPSRAAVTRLTDLLGAAQSPLLVAGRGATDASDAIVRLADRCGALLTTTAVARGLFVGDPWYLDVMGGFATPLAAELIQDSDVVLAFGASLNRWTTRNGTLIGQGTTVVQVDLDLESLGGHRPVQLGVVGDSREVAEAVCSELARRGGSPAGRRRTSELADRIRRGHWRDVPYDDTSTVDRIDPRTLTIALDDLLPVERVVVPDGGNFNGYPAMFLAVPDHRGFCLPLAFQSIGLSLSAAIGAALAQPDRVAVAGIGDGGFMMSLVELDTAVRLRLPLVVIVYNDNAYGAELHHFPGEDAQTVTFPETDIAAIAAGFGCEALTVRRPNDLAAVATWVDGPRSAPLVIDAKTTSFPSWVLHHTFGQE